MTHSGDVRDGAVSGFDEVITINLKKANLNANYIAVLINSFKGVGFQKIGAASVSVMQEEKVILEI